MKINYSLLSLLIGIFVFLVFYIVAATNGLKPSYFDDIFHPREVKKFLFTSIAIGAIVYGFAFVLFKSLGLIDKRPK